MRVVGRAVLRDFYSAEGSQYADAQAPLLSWYHEACKAKWDGPDGLKARYDVSFLENGCVVFNILNHKYLLVTKINYPMQIVRICFVGTPQQYHQN